MQIILQHFDFVMLKSQAKKLNAPLIEQYTGVKDYRAKKEQRKAVFQCITAKNYRDMCNRVKKLSLDDNEIGSSNFDVFMEKLESDDVGWIEEINRNV